MIVTLTSDFGTSDGYVGAMKGVIFSIAPEATIVDISHDVPPQDLVAGALCVDTASATFPRNAIHVAVVDPGVGTDRAPIAIATDMGTFVGPDNGLFALALDRCNTTQPVRLTNPRFHRHPTSTTFHGRDVFAPAAAHLANGVPLADLGEPHGILACANLPAVDFNRDGLSAQVIHVDRFGNLVTNLLKAEFERAMTGVDVTRTTVLIGGIRLGGIRNTYADAEPGQPLAYFGSTGRLEIAVRDGNAADRLQVGAHATVRIDHGG